LKKHVDITISGRVQGVFFRASAKEKADALGISGFVKNESDGRVYLEAEGDELAVKKMIDWCQDGPAGARVEKLEVNDGEVRKYTGFDVRR
jgi:acylphosphatase